MLLFHTVFCLGLLQSPLAHALSHNVTQSYVISNTVIAPQEFAQRLYYVVVLCCWLQSTADTCSLMLYLEALHDLLQFC